MKSALRISGKKHALPSSTEWKIEIRPGGWLIATSPTGARRRFAWTEGRGAFTAAIGGKLLHGEIQEERRDGATGASGGSEADLVAQFPGKVRKLLVATGAQIAEGQPMILVEAMKMEFTVKAPFACTVRKVLVTEGQQLLPGDRFFDVAPAENGNGGNG